MSSKVKLLVVLLSALIVLYGLVGGSMKSVSARQGGVYGDLSVFTEVISRVADDYVEKPDLQKGMTGALHGMLEALDPYCSYVDRATYEKLEDAPQDGTTGIILSKRYGYGYIVAVEPGSSADREGLRTGDLLESIDGKVTTNVSLWEADHLLKGEPGTKVTVRAIRLRRTEPAEVVLSREKPEGPVVTARIVEDGIGLLKIPTFEPGTVSKLEPKLRMLLSSDVKGLLIDLRGNALGPPEEGIKAAGLFLEKGKKIATEKGRDQKATEFVSLGDPIVVNMPVVVLVSGGTSGAAEIFAAALQDQKAAEIVGEKTNGCGSVQTTFTLTDGSALMLSTQVYYRVSGKPIQDQNLRVSGVTPDVRAPDEDFVTNFYFDNLSDDSDTAKVDDEFYRKLNSAVDAEQFRSGLKQIRDKVVKKAA